MPIYCVDAGDFGPTAVIVYLITECAYIARRLIALIPVLVQGSHLVFYCQVHRPSSLGVW